MKMFSFRGMYHSRFLQIIKNLTSTKEVVRPVDLLGFT